MAGKRRTGIHRTNAGNLYIYDNTAPKLDVLRQLEEPRKKRLSHEARRNREKARHMNFGYLVFLAAALCACGMILINYIQMQSELTNRTTSVARLESRLNMLKLENDEKYNRITSNIDLEEIKKVAIGELGMTYAKEGQIIPYQNSGSDYMRRASQ